MNSHDLVNLWLRRHGRFGIVSICCEKYSKKSYRTFAGILRLEQWPFADIFTFPAEPPFCYGNGFGSLCVLQAAPERNAFVEPTAEISWSWMEAKLEMSCGRYISTPSNLMLKNAARGNVRFEECWYEGYAYISIPHDCLLKWMAPPRKVLYSEAGTSYRQLQDPGRIAASCAESIRKASSI